MLSGPGWRRPRFSGLRWVKPEIQSRRSRGRRVARKDGSGNVTYYFEEPVGRARTITGANGVACNEADYYLFGGEQSHGNTCDQNYHFAGMYRDGETGNDYTQFRMYESNLGRWMTPDPLAGDTTNPQSLNRYAYVINNPTNLIDPLGLYKYRPDDAGTVDYFNDFGPLADLINHAPSPGSSQPGGGRGGAGGGGAARTGETPNKAAKNLLNDYFANFADSNCAKVFGKVIPGFSVSAFESKALSTNYYDPYSAPFANYTQNQVTSNGNSTRLWKTFSDTNDSQGGVVALTINGGAGRQSAVLLGPDFFAEGATRQTIDLVHEALHAYRGLSDRRIFHDFGPYGCVPTNKYSSEGISDWIGRDCQP